MNTKEIIKNIKGLSVAFDGCHKIYICETEDDEKEAKEMGYKLYPMEELSDIYERSCPLRFIDNWSLDNTFIPQK